MLLHILPRTGQSPSQNDLVPGVGSVEAEKPWCEETVLTDH